MLLDIAQLIVYSPLGMQQSSRLADAMETLNIWRN